MTIHGGTTGAWEYRTIAPGAAIPAGWVVIYACADHVTIKYTHHEKVYQ